METDAAVPAALPDDVLAAILRRLPTRSLTASRCVCKAWRDLVDEHGLVQRIRRLLPHSVSGIFVNYADHWKPHFFARLTAAAAAGPAVDGNFSYVPEDKPYGWYKVVDHCNGLVLYQREDYGGELYVCNPTNRGWLRLPQLAVSTMRRAYHWRQDTPAPPAGDMEWPPSRWSWHVFSSRSGQWREGVRP